MTISAIALNCLALTVAGSAEFANAMVKLFQRSTPRQRHEETLYLALVAQARAPAFYTTGGVPDTMLGRFEMICLHAFLVFRRLKAAGPAGRRLSQAVHDQMFADMDRSLRELGIGDMGIGKRVKALARNLYGRIAAYDDGLVAGDATLAAALRRNLFATAEADDDQIAAMIDYMHAQDAALAAHDDTRLLAGEVRFTRTVTAPPGSRR